MRTYLCLATFLSFSYSILAANTTTKRGLIDIPSAKHLDDEKIWIQPGSDLTWYYNYGPTPSLQLGTRLEFVPMLWGAPSGGVQDTSFLDSITKQITSGSSIKYVLGFNEPDGPSTHGGSDIDPVLAAQYYIANIEPLKLHNVTLGGPACTGSPSGLTWLHSFFEACAGSCTVDFIPVHWYGNFDGLTSHLGQVRTTYPNASIWVTEYALNNANLADTQSFYNQSADYLDELSYVERYSYFGSFRSSDSNVGPNVALLDKKGKLTQIGSWYLGGVGPANAALKEMALPPTILIWLGMVASMFACYF